MKTKKLSPADVRAAQRLGIPYEQFHSVQDAHVKAYASRNADKTVGQILFDLDQRGLELFAHSTLQEIERDCGIQDVAP